MAQSTNMVRVIIVDDHPLVRDGTKASLDQATGVEVVAMADNGREALALVNAHQPDVLLLDLRLPDISGIDVARELRQRSPGVAIVVVTGYEDVGYSRTLRELGIAGYLEKTASSVEIIAAVRAAGAGETVFDHIASSGQEGSGIDALTIREHEVLTLMAAGKRNADIADELYLSVKTIEFHVGNILAKLGAQSRAGAIHTAHQRGLLL